MESSLVVPPSILSESAIAASAGEIIVEDIMVTNKKQDITKVDIIFLFHGQFLGYIGSLESIQVT